MTSISHLDDQINQTSHKFSKPQTNNQETSSQNPSLFFREIEAQPSSDDNQSTEKKEDQSQKSQKPLLSQKNIPNFIFAVLITFNMFLTLALAGVVYWIMGSALLNRNNPSSGYNDLPNLKTRATAVVDSTTTIESVTLSCTELATDWIYFSEPQVIGTFEANTTQETLLKFDNLLSKDMKIKQIIVAIHVYNGYPGAGQWYAYNVRTSVKNGDKEFIHYTFGNRGDHRLAIYNSESVRFPATNTRELRIKSNKTMTECPINYYLIGYRKE